MDVIDRWFGKSTPDEVFPPISCFVCGKPAVGSWDGEFLCTKHMGLIERYKRFVVKKWDDVGVRFNANELKKEIWKRLLE